MDAAAAAADGEPAAVGAERGRLGQVGLAVAELPEHVAGREQFVQPATVARVEDADARDGRQPGIPLRHSDGVLRGVRGDGVALEAGVEVGFTDEVQPAEGHRGLGAQLGQEAFGAGVGGEVAQVGEALDGPAGVRLQPPGADSLQLGEEVLRSGRVTGPAGAGVGIRAGDFGGGELGGRGPGEAKQQHRRGQPPGDERPPPHPGDDFAAGTCGAGFHRLTRKEAVEIVGEFVGAAVAAGGGLFQALATNRREIAWQLRVERTRVGGQFMNHGGDHFGRTGPVERFAAGQGGVQHRAEAVDIGAGRCRAEERGRLLRGHVLQRSDRLASAGQPTDLLQGGRTTEVSQLRHTHGVEQHVRRLEVAVQHPRGMGGGDPAGEFADDPRRSDRVGGELAQALLQRPAGQPLCYEVVPPFPGARSEEPGDIRVGDPSRGVGFQAEATGRLRGPRPAGCNTLRATSRAGSA